VTAHTIAEFEYGDDCDERQRSARDFVTVDSAGVRVALAFVVLFESGSGCGGLFDRVESCGDRCVVVIVVAALNEEEYVLNATGAAETVVKRVPAVGITSATLR